MGKAEQQFEHLTNAQIEHYGDRTSGEGPNQNGLEIDQAIETHLAACDGCRIRVLEFHRSRFGLMIDPSSSAPSPSGSRSQGSPDSSRSAQTGSTSSLSPTNLDLLYLGRADEHRPTPDCPTADALRDLAAGPSFADDAPRLTQHAAQCPHCGPILRAYTEDFSDDLSLEDQTLLSQLKSATPAWQKKMGQQMAGAVSVPATSAARPSAVAEQSASENARVAQPPSAVDSSSQVRFHLSSLKWIFAPVALAVIAVITFFIWNAQRDTPEKVERLLAQAYTEQRTMEMRWPGAEYGQVRVTRGPEGSLFNKPTQLLEAEGIISRNQQKTETEVRWLQAKGQAAILEHRPDASIAELSRALEQQHGANSATLKLSLAIAYIEKGDSTRDRANYAQAIDLLNWVVRQKPSNHVAMFDLALTYTKMEMWDQAAAAWTNYLRSDADSEWAQEASVKLQQVQAKVHR